METNQGSTLLNLPSRRRRWTGVALALAFSGACGDGVPETAFVEVSSEDETAVTLVTSTDFVVTANTVGLITADTQAVSLPFDREFPLNGQDRFYVSVRPADGDGTLRMQVMIDDRDWYDEARQFGVDTVTAMQFVYRFNVPRLFPDS